MIISHIKKKENVIPVDWAIQTDEEHNNGVAKLSSGFAAEFGFGEWGKVLGLLHDKGKEQDTFQKYILQRSGCRPELKVEGDHTHAYVGAVMAYKLYKQCYPLLSYPIMGHHAGLDDCGEFEYKMQKEIPSDVTKEALDIVPTLPKGIQLQREDCHHLIRMLYSCLVDADWLDTERFMKPAQAAARQGKLSLEQLRPKLEAHLESLKVGATDTPVNRIRAAVQDECRKAAILPSGFFSLTVPTGGGKTLSSLLWAMLHAKEHGKKRIIIAIPFTSIIVQTAEILREIFRRENVLEHHSNVEYTEKKKDEMDTGDTEWQMRLATENWDAPIIVTTNVQLFESMFSNRPSKCRKLHNICNSVLILDEVQSLPLEQIQPIVDSLKTYQRLFGVSVLFTTASQPVLRGEYYGTNPDAKFKGISMIREIVSESFQLHDKLRRVHLSFDIEKSSSGAIAERLLMYPRVLCIVNTRKEAQEIYSLLPQDDSTYHLSRMMCPKHVGDTIKAINEKLKSDTPVIRVVATQLIEAGVDMDFPVVFRQEAGLDSILQAAGRCNREGKLPVADTFVFRLTEDLPIGYLSNSANARKDLPEESDWFHPETMKKYFIQLYSKTNTFDKAEITKKLYDEDNEYHFKFRNAAESFHLIEDSSMSIIVAFENSESLIEELEREGISYDLMKRLAQYSVNVNKRQFEELWKAKLINEISIKGKHSGIYAISDKEQYDKKTGLRRENHWLNETLAI
ncbi:MAG: CRISPR-associated helicase Cas3' [Mediterranea sp.]|nr:CRISPR-associated helicase Cas3' [Mediterranea sp.]